MTTCYQHGNGVHVQYDVAFATCPICRLLIAKDEAIAALSKISEEEAKALEYLDKQGETGAMAASSEGPSQLLTKTCYSLKAEMRSMDIGSEEHRRHYNALELIRVIRMMVR